jgi:hypothetical protein
MKPSTIIQVIVGALIIMIGVTMVMGVNMKTKPKVVSRELKAGGTSMKGKGMKTTTKKTGGVSTAYAATSKPRNRTGANHDDIMDTPPRTEDDVMEEGQYEAGTPISSEDEIQINIPQYAAPNEPVINTENVAKPKKPRTGK